MRQQILLVGSLILVVCSSVSSNTAYSQDKTAPFARGTVGKVLPIPEEFKQIDVVAYFTLAESVGKVVAKAKTVVVTVYKDSKIERTEGGKRIAAKAADIKEGQRIELFDLEEGVQIGESMRIAARRIVIEDKQK